jgi:hypothetical protein
MLSCIFTAYAIELNADCRSMGGMLGWSSGGEGEEHGGGGEGEKYRLHVVGLDFLIKVKYIDG